VKGERLGPPELGIYLVRRRFRATRLSIALRPFFCTPNLSVRFSRKQAIKRAGSILVNPAFEITCLSRRQRKALPFSTTGGNHPKIDTSPSRSRRIHPIRIRGHIHGHIHGRRIHGRTRDRIHGHIRDRIHG
jgi:hypothetical protein